MKKMKVKLLVSRSGVDGSHAAGDIIEVSEREAIALIKNGSAEPKDKKAYESAIAEEEEAIKSAAEEEAKKIAVIEKETLISELRSLYAQVAQTTAKIEGVILSDEEVEAFVEKSMNGEDPNDESGDKNGENFPAGNSDATQSSGDQVPQKGEGE